MNSVRTDASSHIPLHTSISGENPRKMIVQSVVLFSIKDTSTNNHPHFFLDATCCVLSTTRASFQCNRLNQTPKNSARAFQTGGPRSKRQSHNFVVSVLDSS